MVHTIYLDDEYINVKKILKELYRQEQGVRFENPNINSVLPEGYMTVEQFRTEAKASLTKILNKNGIY